MIGAKALKMGAKDAIKSVRDLLLIPKIAASYHAYKRVQNFNNKVNELGKKFATSKDSGITLTNNEIKDIIKVINSLRNRGILFK